MTYEILKFVKTQLCVGSVLQTISIYLLLVFMVFIIYAQMKAAAGEKYN